MEYRNYGLTNLKTIRDCGLTKVYLKLTTEQVNFLNKEYTPAQKKYIENLIRNNFNEDLVDYWDFSSAFFVDLYKSEITNRRYAVLLKLKQ